jgi:hypothetical protein
VPTLLPWASFISTTVLATLDSGKKMIVDNTAAIKNRLCFMVTNYNQAAAPCAISSLPISAAKVWLSVAVKQYQRRSQITITIRKQHTARQGVGCSCWPGNPIS